MQHFARFVNHTQFQRLGCSRNDGESRFGATEYCTFDRVYLTAERTAGVGHIVDVAAIDTHMLEVVDVTTYIHIYMMTAQNGVDTLLHVLTLDFVFRRLGIDRMVTDYNHPVFFGCSQNTIQPLQLVVNVCRQASGYLSFS